MRGKALISRFDDVAFLLRARHAALGAGNLSIRRQGTMRVLTSVIPGTKIRAMIRETPRRTVAGFVPKSANRPDIDITGVDGMVRFLCTWDTMLMRNGFGAAYFPVAALEFITALVHDEGRRDILSIRPGTEAAAGFGIIATPEWKPTPELQHLITHYGDDENASACARQAAWDLADFIRHGEDKPFDEETWKRMSAIRGLRSACRDGREIPSETGIWHEVLDTGAVNCAIGYLSSRAPNPRIASTAMKSHLGVFRRHHRFGGCDFYVLWNDNGLPTAISAVSVSGDIVAVDTPRIPAKGFQPEDIEMLVGAVGNDVSVAQPRGTGHT